MGKNDATKSEIKMLISFTLYIFINDARRRRGWRYG